MTETDPFEDKRAADEYVAAFARAWYAPRPTRSWATSVRRWRSYGLDLDTLLDLAEQVLTNDYVRDYGKWRYLSGAVWNTLKEEGKWPPPPTPKPHRPKLKPVPSTTEVRIVEALANGPMRRGALAAALGMDTRNSNLDRMLRRLEAAGRIKRPRYGLWALAGESTSLTSSTSVRGEGA